MGPTGSGKSDVAEALAVRHNLQLINADAFMVYKGFDIGTNKPTNKAAYELIDIIESTQEFGVGEWIRRTIDVLERIHTNSSSDDVHAPKGAIVVGGTGFYIRALFEQYTDLQPAPDPELRRDLELRLATEGLQSLVDELQERAPDTAQSIDLQNPVRVRRALERLYDPNPPIQFTLPPFRKLKFILDPDAALLDQSIEKRTKQLLDSGWKKEVVDILSQGVPRTAPAFRAIGYDCIIDLIEGRLGEEEAVARITASTRQYAKRQRTWLRTEPNATTVPTDGTQPPFTTISNALNSPGGV